MALIRFHLTTRSWMGAARACSGCWPRIRAYREEAREVERACASPRHGPGTTGGAAVSRVAVSDAQRFPKEAEETKSPRGARNRVGARIVPPRHRPFRDLSRPSFPPCPAV